uniref:LITAF domain-containing protein n=1 Tax=Acrobeloides nanus TaxID=290746 RepID=A0A914CFJ7_9BILA
MDNPPSKLAHETTPLAQDHRNQEIASAQGPPPPYIPPPSSIPYAPTTTTVVVVPLEFNSKPAKVMCPSCNMSITTRVEHEAGTMTWMLCCFVSIFVLCCDFTKDVNHFCPICHRRLGTYRRPCSSRIVTFIILINLIIPIITIILLAMSDSHRYNG